VKSGKYWAARRPHFTDTFGHVLTASCCVENWIFLYQTPWRWRRRVPKRV